MNTRTSTRSNHQSDVIAEDNIVRSVSDGNHESFMNDAAYAIQICRRYLKIFGVWLPINTGAFSWRTVLGNVSVIAFYFSAGIRGIPTGLYLIFDEKRPSERLRLMIRLVFIFMSLFKYTSLRKNRRNIDKCMKHIELDWLNLECTTSRNIMLERVHFGHVLIRICAVFTYASVILIAMLPFLTTKLLDDKSHIINTTETVSVRRFAVPSHFGLSVFSKTPIYEVVYTCQVIANFVLHSMTITCYSLAVVIVMHACGQLNVLMGKLSELVDGGGKMTMHDSIDSRTTDIIKHHVRTLRRVQEFRAETKHTIAICTWTTFLVTFTFNVFSFCYIGELLTQECMKVGEVTYMIDWHRLPGKKCLDLALIITMAQTPVTLTAGGAIQLSMRCFATVVKTAAGYLNMLRTVMD